MEKKKKIYRRFVHIAVLGHMSRFLKFPAVVGELSSFHIFKLGCAHFLKASNKEMIQKDKIYQKEFF